MKDIKIDQSAEIEPEKASINMVLNGVEWQERVLSRGNKAEVSGHMQPGIHYFAIAIVSLVFLVSLLLLLFVTIGKTGFVAVLFLIPLFLILVRAGRFYSENSLSAPANLIVEPSGLRIVVREPLTRVSTQLFWEDMDYAELVVYASRNTRVQDGSYVFLHYDLSGYSRSRQLAYLLQFMSLAAFKRESLIKGILNGRLRFSFMIPLDLFTLEADKDRLLSSLQRYAKPEALGDSIKEAVETKVEIGFTKLWLDDLQSFKRKRLHTLTGGTELCGGRYRVEEPLSAGGQAQIYQCHDNEENRKVALKEFVLPVDAGHEVRDRSFANVKNEALMLASLEHPGVVRLYDHFVEDHRAYLVLEFVDGKNLRTLVKENGALSPDLVKDYSLQIARILEYLHGMESPVVHRDLSPDNLICTEAGRIKLIDFNVAKLMESDITRTVVGKHAYMAPEQFRGYPCEASDLYSLGCTIAYLLAGEDPIPLTRTEIAEDKDVELKELVFDLTALKVEERLDNAAELIARLEQIA